MDTSKKLQASKVINAPAEDIFALLADPNRHTEIDGADMLRGPEGDAAPIGGIGQTFTMNMHAPDLGDYRMINTMAFLSGARIGWGPRVDPTCGLAEQLGDMDAGGHTYTYEPQGGRGRDGGHPDLRVDEREGRRLRGVLPPRLAGTARHHTEQPPRSRHLTAGRRPGQSPRRARSHETGTAGHCRVLASSHQAAVGAGRPGWTPSASTTGWGEGDLLAFSPGPLLPEAADWKSPTSALCHLGRRLGHRRTSARHHEHVRRGWRRGRPAPAPTRARRPRG